MTTIALEPTQTQCIRCGAECEPDSLLCDSCCIALEDEVAFENAGFASESTLPY